MWTGVWMKTIFLLLERFLLTTLKRLHKLSTEKHSLWLGGLFRAGFCFLQAELSDGAPMPVATAGLPRAFCSDSLRTCLFKTAAVNGNLFNGTPSKSKTEVISAHKCRCSYDAGLLQLFYFLMAYFSPRLW